MDTGDSGQKRRRPQPIRSVANGACWLVVAACLFGCAERQIPDLVSGEPLDQPAADGAFSVTGKVTLAASGEPASGVSVLVLRGQGNVLRPRSVVQQVTTNKAGRYRVDGLAPGPYFLRVKAPGLAGDDCFAVARGDSETLERNFLLAPASIIEGRVIDARTGEPVPDFPVRARTANNLPDLRATTDASGAFRVEGLTAGLVHLFPGSNMGWLCQPTGIPDACRVIPVGTGTTVSGIDLPVSWTGRIEGRVTDAAGKPVPDATVSVESDTPGLRGVRREAVTDSDGRYRLIAIVPGVAIRLEVIADKFASAQRELVSSPDTAKPLRVDVSLVPRKYTIEPDNPFSRRSTAVWPKWNATLEGTVRVSGGGVLPDLFRVRVCPAWGNKAFSKHTAFECKSAHHSTLRRAATPFGKYEGGRFVRKELPPGPTRVEVTASGYIIETLDVDLPEHGSTSIEVTLNPGATVQGTVVDAEGNGIEGAVLYSSRSKYTEVPDDFTANAIRGIRGRAIAVSDGEGRFSTAGLRPGKHKLIALAPGLEPSRPVTAELEAGQTSAGHVFRVLAGGSIAGRLLRVGKPAAGQVVKLYVGNELRSVTDARGEFVFAGLPPGQYTMVFPGAGWRPPEEPRLSVLVRRGETNDKELDLGTLGGLTGRLWQEPVGQYGNSTGYSVRLLVPGSRTFSELASLGIDPHRSGEYRVAQVGFAHVFEPGRFDIPNVPPGRYLLELHGPRPRGQSTPRDCAATTATTETDPESPQPSEAELERQFEATCGGYGTLLTREIEIRPSETLELDLAPEMKRKQASTESAPPATWDQQRAKLTEISQRDYAQLHPREMEQFYGMRRIAIHSCLRRFGSYCSCHYLGRSGFWIDPDGKPRNVWISGIGSAAPLAARKCREDAIVGFRFPPPPPGKTVQVLLKAHGQQGGDRCRGSRWSPDCREFFKRGPGQVEDDRLAKPPLTPAQAAKLTWFVVMDGRKGVRACLDAQKKRAPEFPDTVFVEFQVPTSGGRAQAIRIQPRTLEAESLAKCVSKQVSSLPFPEYEGQPFDVRVLFPTSGDWRFAEVEFRGISPDGRRDGLLAAPAGASPAGNHTSEAAPSELLSPGSTVTRALDEPVIAGSVMDRSGAPVAGADVTVEKKRWFSSDEYYRTATTGDGSFTLDKGISGTARLSVTHPDHGEPTSLVIKPAKGKGVETRFVMPEKPGLQIEGKLTFRGHPLSNERIIAECSRRGRYAITDAAGHFRLRNLSPGRCRLQVFTRGWSPRGLELDSGKGAASPGVPHGLGSIWTELQGQSAASINIDVASLASVSGKVDRRGSGYSLKVQLALPGQYGDDSRVRDYLTEAWVDQDGEFTIPERFEAGDYELRLVRIIECDGGCIDHVDLAREPVSLRRGEALRVVHLAVPSEEKMKSLLEKCK